MNEVQWSPNRYHSGYRPENVQPVECVVIHYTAGGALEATIAWFQNPDSSASAHYVIGRDGRVVQMVPLEDRAWHAGVSRWRGRRGVNRFSWGIELCNWGRLTEVAGGGYENWTGRRYKGPAPYLDGAGQPWEPFPDAQIEALVRVLRHLVGVAAEAGTDLLSEEDRILGHEHVAPGRKIDPGPAFPWIRVREQLAGEAEEEGPGDRIGVHSPVPDREAVS